MCRESMKIIWVFACFLLGVHAFEEHLGNSWQHDIVSKDFVCRDGATIMYAMFCNGMVECEDGSDEKTHSALYEEFDPMGEWQKCENPTNTHSESCLVERRRICNGDAVCSNLTPCDLNCDSHYTCQSGSCEPRSTVCNGNRCDGCQEEQGWKNGPGFKCMRNGAECIIPQQLLHDNVSDCDGGVDICFTFDDANGIGSKENAKGLDRDKCYQCLDGAMIVPASRVCDGVIDCIDLSDECLCEDIRPAICDDVIMRGERIEKIRLLQSKLNSEMVLLPAFSGDGVAGILEENQKDRQENATKCDVGHVMCGENVCIRRQDICDGVRDCTHDENYDFCRGTIACGDAVQHEKLCRCNYHHFCTVSYGEACNGVADCSLPLHERFMYADTPPEDECEAFCFNENTNFTCTMPSEIHFHDLLSQIPCDPVPFNHSQEDIVGDMVFDIPSDKKCDGRYDCPLGDDEAFCPERFSCVTKHGGFVSIAYEEVCNGIEDCQDGSDESEVRCRDWRFHCAALGGAQVSIDKSLICDYSISCDDGSDEINCHDGRFYCENGEPLFVKSRKTFDGRGDCSDWSDECPMLDRSTAPDAFHSRYELIGNPILRALVWIMGILAVFGNLAVIIREGNKMRNLSRLPCVIAANRLLVLNLATSDIIMGIYLVALAAAGLSMQGSYCSQDLAWRSSNLCVALGVMTVVSSETSVITMGLLTGCRLYAVIRPFKSANQPRKRYVCLMMLTAWAASVSIALIPLAPAFSQVFITHAQFMYNPYARNALTSLDGVKDLVRSLMTYGLKANVSVEGNIEKLIEKASWSELRVTATQYFQNVDFTIERYFGYYSIHSVCIPKFFVTTSDSAWKFSFAVNLFNFLAFIFVASAYTAIYIKSSKAVVLRAKKSRKNERDMTSMQRKILRLIITDFFCWIPICIMSFCKLVGASVGNTAYAFSAIVLLPINSSLNPLLYSDIPDSVYSKLIRRFRHTRRGSTTTQTHQTSCRNGTINGAATIPFDHLNKKLSVEKDGGKERAEINTNQV